MPQITEQRLDEALQFLASTDEKYANARGLSLWLEEQKSIVRCDAFRQAMASGDMTVAMAESIARTDANYRATVDKLRDAITAETLLRARRERAAITVELFRTMEASRRRGNIT